MVKTPHYTVQMTLAMYHTKQLFVNVGKECKGEEMDTCIICGLTANDEETEISMESSKCLHWVHKSCLPPHYLHAETDIFLCPECAVYFYYHHR